MAEWKQQKLGNPKILEHIGKQADQAIEAVNIAMGIVQTGGEVAKLVLLSSMNPVLLAMKAVGEAIVDMANNYREAGFYALYVGYGDGSTRKEFLDYGIAMQRDKNGNYIFEDAYQLMPPPAAQLVKNYPVNTKTEPEFVKSLDKWKLSDKIRDSGGRNAKHGSFKPPMPVFEYPWRFIRGGWTPKRLDGGSSYDTAISDMISIAPNFPQIPATSVVKAMIDAFDDEGDVPLYEWSDPGIPDINTTPVYTREGIRVQNSKQQYAKIGSTKNPGGELSEEDKAIWEISAANWNATMKIGATFYTHLYNKKESLRPSTSVWGSSTFTTVVKSGKPSFKGVGDITIPAETKLVKTGTAGGENGKGGTLGSSIGTYEVQEIAPAKTIAIPNNVVGIAIVAGLADFQAFYDLLNTLMNFFGDWPAVKDAIDDINTLLKTERQNIQLEQDILWGPFDESAITKLGADPDPDDKYIIGATSGAVGKIITMIEGGQNEENRISKWMIKDTIVSDPNSLAIHLAGAKVIQEAVDTNDDPYLKRWYMHEYKIEKVSGQDFDFTPGEYVYQISEEDGGVIRGTKGAVPPNKTFDEYFIPQEEDSMTEEFLEQKVFKAESEEAEDLRSDITSKIAGMGLPPYGIVTGAEFENPPASVQPDFVGFQFKEFIPYWAEVFDGIAMFGQAIVDIAEALLAFIQKIIDFIDLVIEKLQELANAIISFIEYFKIGIPAQGIYLLGVSTSDGNKGIQSALESADNGPPASLKYSSGILLVGVTDNTGTNGVEILGQLLALDFTDFSLSNILSGEFAKGDPAKAEAELEGTGLGFEVGLENYDTDGRFIYNINGQPREFAQLKGFKVKNSGSGYTKAPSITIKSSGSVVSFIQPKLEGLDTNVTHYVERPEGGGFSSAEPPTFKFVPEVEEVIGVEEVLYKATEYWDMHDAGAGIIPDGVEVGDLKFQDDIPIGKSVGDVKVEGVTAVEPVPAHFAMISPGHGYVKAPKVYVGGGGKPFSNTVTQSDGVDFNYHTIFTTVLSKAPRARAILEKDKITKISLDSTGNSYFVVSGPKFTTEDGKDVTTTTPQIDIGGVPLKSIKITEAGRLYKEIPRISFVPGSGGGRGAAAEVTKLGIKGQVEEIELTSPGEEYTSAPEIKISNP